MTPVSRFWPLRLLVGLVLMPPTAAVVAFAIFPAYWWLAAASVGAGEARGDLFDAARGFGLAAGLVAVVVTIGGALPLVTALVARGVPLTLARSIRWGVVLGIAPFVILFGGAGLLYVLAGVTSLDGGLLGEGLGVLGRGVLLGFPTGAACAAVFWFVVRDPYRPAPVTSAPAGVS